VSRTGSILPTDSPWVVIGVVVFVFLILGGLAVLVATLVSRRSNSESPDGLDHLAEDEARALDHGAIHAVFPVGKGILVTLSEDGRLFIPDKLFTSDGDGPLARKRVILTKKTSGLEIAYRKTGKTSADGADVVDHLETVYEATLYVSKYSTESGFDLLESGKTPILSVSGLPDDLKVGQHYRVRFVFTKQPGRIIFLDKPELISG